MYGLVLTALLIRPAWHRIQIASHSSNANRALTDDDLSSAIASLNRLDQLQPGSAEVQYRLAVAQRRAGVIDAALFHLRRAERLGWPQQPIERQRVLAHFQAGAIDENKTAIEGLLDQKLDSQETEEVYEALLKGYLSAFRLVEARACLHYWLEWQPDAVQAKMWLGQLLEFQHDDAAAAKAYESVLATAPNHQEARLRLAAALVEENRVADALDIYTQLHREQPDDMGILLGLARCERNAGQEDQAREHLNQALASTLPSRLRGLALVESGQISLANQDVSTAIEQLSEAVRLDPGNQQAHHALGTALARGGQQALAQIHLDHSAAMLKRHDRIRDLTQDLLRQPNNADLQFEVGRTLLELGLKHEALRWLLLAAAGDSPPAATHASLADLYAELGNQPLEKHHRALAQRQATLEPTTPQTKKPK